MECTGEMHNKPQHFLSSYTGDYNNELYGKIQIRMEKDHLFIQFETKPDLNATLEYMDEGEWLLKYNNIVYGMFEVKFDIIGRKSKITDDQTKSICGNRSVCV